MRDTAELCCKTKKGLEYAVKALPKHCFHYYGELSDGFFETVESLALGDRLTVWTELDRSDLHAAIKKHARLGVSLLSEPSELDAAKKSGADIAETKGQLKPEANSGAIADMHTHSDISHDCRVRLEDMRQAAEARGVGLMAVTNHADVGFMNAKRIFEIISETAAEVMELNARNDSPCRLLTGVEIGDGIFDVGLMRFAEKAWDCDVIIGSVHCGTVDGRLEPYSKFDFSSRSDEFAEEFLADYFDNLNKTVDAADFDILAHLTCPLRYIVGRHKKNVDMSKYDGVINEILEKIIKKGIALELNTSSVSLAVGDFVPSREILKKYRAMGGYLVTLGSDAHVIEEAAANFDQALALLNELGFKNVYYYKKRRVLPIPVCG